MSEPKEHRWSGWPGAWCLDCGISDPWEAALANGDIEVICQAGGEYPFYRDEEAKARIEALRYCPEPGSKRHDPYARADEQKP